MDPTTSAPTAGRIASSTLLLITLIVLSFCLSRRTMDIKSWRTLPVAAWLVLGIYVDSILFVSSTTIVEMSFSFNSSSRVCDNIILLCLTFYVAAKVGLYLFFVEKVYVIRNPWTSRLKDKVYLFNMIVLIGVYVMFAGLCFWHRLGHIDSNGMCRIGVKRRILVPLTLYEALINIFLTCLFLAPLRKLHSFSDGGPVNHRLRKVAMRTLVGSSITLTSTCANLAVLAAMDGEPGWACVLACNLDVLLAVSVVHWATSLDKEEPSQSTTTSTSTSKTPEQSRSSMQAPSTMMDFDRIILNEIDAGVDVDIKPRRNAIQTIGEIMVHVDTIEIVEFIDVDDLEKGIVFPKRDSQSEEQC